MTTIDHEKLREFRSATMASQTPFVTLRTHNLLIPAFAGMSGREVLRITHYLSIKYTLRRTVVCHTQ
jgi:hypothetical protein